MYKCKKGVLWKNSAASFFLNGMEQCIKLSKSLQDGTYKPAKPCKFKITSPKPRDIISISFRDRVYQRSLNDNVVYPNICKSFIYDNMACQKGKGTHLAVARLKSFLCKSYRKYGKNFYIAQFDIHGYYPNMRHLDVKAKFKKHLDSLNYQRCCDVFDNQYEGKIGFNPGSQMVQIAGISLLDGMDHFIKERLKVKFYERYMDDFILISNNEKFLYDCSHKIKLYLNSIGLTLNFKKSKIFSINKGVTFLGFKFKITDNGKVITMLNPINIKRERKKLYRLVRLCERGKITKKKLYECYNSWKSYTGKSNSYKLITRMDNYVKGLWRDNNASIN